MSKTNAWESDLLTLVFNNTDAANIGNAGGLRGSTVAGSFYVSLHTADPGETGNQTTSETSYSPYARVAVARSGAGWTISATAPTQAANTSAVTFAQCASGSGTITYVGVGTDATTAGHLMYSGQLGSSLSVSVNITPSFASSALVITED